MKKITLFGHNPKKSGFSLIEAVMSVTLIMIFLFGVYKFFNVQNKNISSLIVENNTVNLIEDASLYIADVDYDELVPGLYGFYFYEKNYYDAEYRLVPISYEEDFSYEEGKYMDEKGHLVNYDPQYPDGVYKMLIKVYPETEVFEGQNFKNINIYAWYNGGCDFDGVPCITKDFIKVGGNTDNLIWEKGLSTDIDSLEFTNGVEVEDEEENKVSGDCTGLPANATFYSGVLTYAITDAPAGTSLTGSYDSTPDENTCQYSCNLGYTGSECNSFLLGYGVSNPGVSCYNIKNTIPTSIDGVYWIKPDSNPAFQVYCDMTNDGGGWTLVQLGNKDIGTTNPVITTSSYNYPPLLLSPTVIDNFKLSDSVINSLKSNNDYFIRIKYGTGYIHKNCVLNTTAPQDGSGPCSYGTLTYGGAFSQYNNGTNNNAIGWARGLVIGCYAGTCVNGFTTYYHDRHASPYDKSAAQLWVK